MRIIFFGTPEFAVPTLTQLISSSHYKVVGVVCQPDRRAGRGNKLHEPPVKVVARQHHIPTFQPERLSKAPEVLEELRKLSCDLIVMVAFGQILKKSVLELPQFGVINVHASLLPAYRGAAPINWAIINGESKTGVTTMFTEAGLDTGPMLLKQAIDIEPDTRSDELSKKLSVIGAELLIQTLEHLQNGTLKPEPQDDTKATYAPMLTKQLGAIDWNKNAQTIHNLVRGLHPWPSAHTTFRENPIKILRTKSPTLQSIATTSGVIMRRNNQVCVSCGTAAEEMLEILEVQPANRGHIKAIDWINGLRLESNEKFC